MGIIKWEERGGGQGWGVITGEVGESGSRGTRQGSRVSFL